MVRGTMPGMVPGTILGHEGVGVVEEVGPSVRDFKVGDRVVVPSTICCGHCSYCTAGYHSQCDNANPNGKQAGTAFFGGPKTTGPLNGLQAEFARVPLADPTLVKLPARDDRRPGHPPLRHLPDRLLRGRHGRDQAGRHGLRVRLRPGRAVRHRQRQAARGRPRLRRRHAPRPAGQGPRAGGRDDRLQRRAPGREAQGADRRGIGVLRAIDAVGRGRLPARRAARPTPSRGR